VKGQDPFKIYDIFSLGQKFLDVQLMEFSKLIVNIEDRYQRNHVFSVNKIKFIFFIVSWA